MAVSSNKASGGYIQEEITEMTRWANQYLGVGGYSEHLITDLTSDLSDGITLLRLVQSLLGEALPRHNPCPMMKVQRIENLRLVLEYLKTAGIHLAVHPEELAAGSMKAALAVCKSLRRHFTAGPLPSTCKGFRSFSFSSLEKEDIAILTWAGEILHRSIPNYGVLYDGRLLCELLNNIRDGTFLDEEINRWNSDQRLRNVISASEDHFFLPRSTIDIRLLHTGSQDMLLRGFLQQMKTVYLQEKQLSTHSSQYEVVMVDTHRQTKRAGSYSDLTVTKPTSSLTKHSSTEALQKACQFVPLDRHASVDTGIASSRRDNLLHTTSPAIRTSLLEGINTPTFESRKRGSSYSRLESGGSVDELNTLVGALEERLATLTAQFLFERQDMYRRMDRALVRERKRRQAVESRLRDLEGLVTSLVKHYDSKLIDMAKQVSVLRGELLVAQSVPTPVTMDIAALKDKIESLHHQSSHRTTVVEQGLRPRSKTLFVRKQQQYEQDSYLQSLTQKKPKFQTKKDQVYSRGSLTSFKKLSAFFGAEPPRLEDITTFLEGLGYVDLIQKFTGQDVTLAELAVMSDGDLERLGVPLGPRLRILQEVKKLTPLDKGTVI